MSRFDLLDNFVDNPETLMTKTKAKLRRNQSTSSSAELTNPPKLEDQPVVRSLTLELDIMADKSLLSSQLPLRPTYVLDQL